MSWKAIFAEFFSTSILIFLGCMSCLPIAGFTIQPPLYAPLAFGLIVLLNIEAFGHISGAHMNPAVTLGAVLWGKMSIALGSAYIIAQIIGAIAGYGLLLKVSAVDVVSNAVCTTRPQGQHTVFQAVVIEAILTAALNFLNCACWDPMNKKSLESVSVKFGFIVTGLCLAGGPLTGAGMNPARSFAPALWTGTWDSHWIYWLGPLLGGALSVLFYKYIWLNKTAIEMERKEIEFELTPT